MRLVRGLALVMIILVGLVLGTVALVVLTPGGTGFALRRAVQWYDGSIPGHVTFSRSTGPLSDLCLHDVRLADAEDRPLITVRRLCLRATLWSLVDRELEIEALTIAEPVIHLWPDAAWSDLAPPGPEPPPSEPPGPEIPVRVDAPLVVWGLEVVRHDEHGQDQPLVHDAGLHAVLAAEGRWARVQLAMVWGQVPPASLFVIGGRTELHWTSPTLEVQDLQLVSSAGIVQSLSGHLDVQAMTYAAQLRGLAFVPPTGGPSVTAAVELLARGSAEQAAVSARVRTSEYGRADVHAVASFQPTLSASAIVHVDPAPRLSRAPIDAWLTARQGEDDELQAMVFATTPGALLVASWDGAQARARAFVDGARAHVDATVEDGALQAVEATLTVRSAAQATAALDRLLPAEIPRIEGEGEVDTVCHNGETLHCRVQASVRRERDWVETTAELHVGDRLVIELHRLRGQLRGQPVQLDAPAEIRVGEGSASLSRLRLRAAKGTIEAAGRVVWADEGRSDLDVALRELDLGIISRFVPNVPIRGRLSGALTLQGDRLHPELTASLAVRRLGWAKDDLGGVTLRARYDDRRAEAEVRWRVGSMRTRVFADVPLDLALGGPPPRLRTAAPMQASVDVTRLELSQVSRWIEGPALAGTVRATVRAGGTLRDPIVVAKLTGAHLEVADAAVGNAEITAVLRDDYAHASVAAVGDAIGEVQVDATVPLSFSPSQGVRHHPRKRHHVAARVVGVDLRKLEAMLVGPGEDTSDAGALALAGHVRAELEATAEDGRVEGHVALLGYDLHARGLDVGAAQIDLAIEPTQILAQVVVSGPWARAVELGARLPLELEALTEPRWHGDEPLAARLVLHDVDLQALGQLGLTPGLAGRLEGSVDVSGTPRHPTLAAQLDVDGLRSNDQSLGHARLHASYGDDTLHAWLEQGRGAEELEVSVQVPLLVDLAVPAVEWQRHQPHALSLRAQGIDQRTVGSVVDVPRGLEFLAAARVEASGTIDDPRVVARLRGSVAAQDTIDTPVAVLVDLGPQRQHARVMLGAHGPQGLVIEAHTAAPLGQVIEGTADLQATPIDLQVSADDFQLRELQPLLPDALHDPRGTLDLALAIEGTLASPTLVGTLAIDDAAITVVPLNQEFSRIRLRAALDGPDVVLESFSAKSGDGSISATARLHVEPQDTRGAARLVTRKLPIVRPGLPMMRLDTRVQATLDASKAVTAVDVEIHDTFLDVLEMTPLSAAKRIPSDEGVIYVDAAGIRAQERTEDGPTPWLPPSVELSLTLADPLRVRGPSADMAWTGHIEVLRPAEGMPKTTGSFSINDGRVSLLGNDFDIESAQIRFPEVGDLDPYIDLVAITDTEEALVTMSVRGRISRPTLQLRSDPPMPESDIFALLVTGHADANQASDEAFSAKAAGVLAAFSNPELQRYLRDRVGIDRVGVGFGDTLEQPIVTVGKRFSRKIYVEAGYHHNAPPNENAAEVRLEYRFAPPRWSVETWFGDAAEGGVGLWWRRRFGAWGQRRAAREAARAEAKAKEDAAKTPSSPSRP